MQASILSLGGDERTRLDHRKRLSRLEDYESAMEMQHTKRKEAALDRFNYSALKTYSSLEPLWLDIN